MCTVVVLFKMLLCTDDRTAQKPKTTEEFISIRVLGYWEGRVTLQIVVLTFDSLSTPVPAAPLQQIGQTRTSQNQLCFFLNSTGATSECSI